MITVDCGINSVAEVAAARARGIAAVVTDHHQPGEELPDCPIVHPIVSGYPYEHLCAAGVAHKLAAALAGAERAERDLDLVALATVADMVPLTGENRSLVRRGLEQARRGARPGLRALMAVAQVAPERLDEGALGFRLAPRINAAGRLYRADGAVELFLTDDEERAALIAAELDRLNQERRQTEAEVLADAERRPGRPGPEGGGGAGDRALGRGLAPGRGRDLRLAPRGAAVEADRPDRPRRRSRPRLRAQRAGVRPAGRPARLRGNARPLRRASGRGRPRDRARRGSRASASDSGSTRAGVLDRRSAIRTEAMDAVVGGEALGP